MDDIDQTTRLLIPSNKKKSPQPKNSKKNLTTGSSHTAPNNDTTKKSTHTKSTKTQLLDAQKNHEPVVELPRVDINSCMKTILSDIRSSGFFFASQYPNIDDIGSSNYSENFITQNKRSHKSIIRLYILKKGNPASSLSHQGRITTFKNITTWVEGSIKNKIFMTTENIKNMLGYNKVLPSTTGSNGYFLVPQDFNIFVEYLRCTIISIIHNIPVRDRNKKAISQAVEGGSSIQNNIPVPMHSPKINVRLSQEMEKIKSTEITIMKTQDIKSNIEHYATTVLTSNRKHNWSQLRIRQSENSPTSP